MKKSDIKTRSEFYEFADIWYQRACRLRSIYNDKKEPIKRRQKAFKLWAVMADRVMNFEDGGVPIV